MKKNIDTKTVLFENMRKINPDFKLNESDEKWIQKAVDPEHKGYCTPMSKPTCTPRRKALAKRFKKGIENEGIEDYFDESLYRTKVETLKKVIDKLFEDEDYDIIDTLYRLMVDRKAKRGAPLVVREEEVSPQYKRKAEMLKGKVDFLYDNSHYDILDAVDDLITKLYSQTNEPESAEQ